MGAGLVVDEGDARITRVGALLRRTSLDELPNLSTSCAARCRSSARARPCRSRSTATRSASAAGSPPAPGITGWAQVNGRASLPWHERIELDLCYLEHASLRLDLRILARHASAWPSTGHGLYRGETGGWREPPAGESGGSGSGDLRDRRYGTFSGPLSM